MGNPLRMERHSLPVGSDAGCLEVAVDLRVTSSEDRAEGLDVGKLDVARRAQAVEVEERRRGLHPTQLFHRVADFEKVST